MLVLWYNKSNKRNGLVVLIHHKSGDAICKGDRTMAIVPRNDIPGKVCNRCEQWKPLGDFGAFKLARDGYENCCTLCRKPRKRYVQHSERDGAEGKVCSVCKDWKSLDQFNHSRAPSDGLGHKCRDCSRILGRAYVEANIDVHRADNRAAYHKNADARKAQVMQYRAANRDKINAYDRERNKNRYRQDPIRRRMYTTVRRARDRANGEGFTTPQWRALCAKYGNRCLCCGKQEPEIKLSPDHIIPVSLGGKGTIDNIQPLCIQCNKRKHTKTTDYRPDRLV